MPKMGAPEASARERLLASADELFYREGVQTVGIDRIISHAGVAKASLTTFSAARKGELFTDPGFKGCAFEMASAEAPPGGAVERAAGIYREWVQTLFATLAQEAGVADPDALARQFHLLYDGAGLSARMDHDPSAATTARAAAAALLDAAQRRNGPEHDAGRADHPVIRAPLPGSLDASRELPLPARMAAAAGGGYGNWSWLRDSRRSRVRCHGPGRLRKPGVGSVEWRGLPFSPFLADSLKPIRAGRR